MRLCLLILCVLLTPAAAAQSAAPTCGADFDAMVAYLAANDAGLAGGGAPPWPDISAAQRNEPAASAACTEWLKRAAAQVRAKHLAVESLAPQAPDEPALSAPAQAQTPTLKVLSPTTLVLQVPAFDEGDALARLLRRDAKAMAQRPVWLIDVRGNGGGSDHVWAPLLARLGLRSRMSWPIDFLATPANAAAHRRVSALFQPGPELTADLEAIARRLDAAPSGTWVPMVDGESGAPQEQDMAAAQGPKVVAILVDRRCASSCEEFLLAARQSWRVKLFGQPSAGALDVSNLRPQPLPSGQHMLWYATSRSQRMPLLPVDGRGVAPDVLLPAPTDAKGREAELARVRRIAERARR